MAGGARSGAADRPGDPACDWLAPWRLDPGDVAMVVGLRLSVGSILKSCVCMLMEGSSWRMCRASRNRSRRGSCSLSIMFVPSSRLRRVTVALW